MLSSRRVGGSMRPTENETERSSGAQSPTVETNLRSLILIKMPVAQILRSFDEVGPLKISAHVGVPRISTLFRPSRTERFSFQLPVIDLLEFSHDLTRQFRVS
jgi:hypothetical protein